MIATELQGARRERKRLRTMYLELLGDVDEGDSTCERRASSRVRRTEPKAGGQPEPIQPAFEAEHEE